MPLSSHLGSYNDVKNLFNAALARDGVRCSFPSPAKLHHFRQRAYKFRKLLHEKQEQIYPGTVTETPYDVLQIVRDPEDKCTLHIRPAELEAVVTDDDGNEVVIEDEQIENATPDFDALDAAAEEIRRLDLGDS